MVDLVILEVLEVQAGLASEEALVVEVVLAEEALEAAVPEVEVQEEALVAESNLSEI
jgi:hypothetical protein